MQVRITDGTSNDVPRISEADLQGSRHSISVYLSTHTTYELLPESGKVWMPCHWPCFIHPAFGHLYKFNSLWMRSCVLFFNYIKFTGCRLGC